MQKTGSIRTLFKELDSDFYKPIRTDGGFAGRNNNYIEYKSKGDRYENLSSEEYLNVIRPYLRDLINKHKPTVELNTTTTNNNNDNKNSNSNSNSNRNSNDSNNDNNYNSNDNSNSNNNNIEKSYTEKNAKHDPSGWAMFTRCSFDKKKKNLIITEESIVLKNYVKN